MSLTNVALFASILSGFAVAGSLVYLGIQIRQNARHARAQIQQHRVTRLVDQMIGFSDADKCAAYIRGNGGDPTPEAIKDRQFMMQCLAQFGTILDAHTQHQDGLLNDEQFDAVSRTYKRWFGEKGFREMFLLWRNETGFSDGNFNNFIDRLLADIPVQGQGEQ